MNGDIKRILVISGQGMGDLLLFTPALHLLRENFPGAKISVLITEKSKDIILGNPNVDEPVLFDYQKRLDPLYAIFFIFSIRRKKFDLSICAYPSGLRSALIGYLSGARIRVGQRLSFLRRFHFLFTVNVEVRDIKHAVEMNLDLLRALKLKIDQSPAKLFMPIAEDDERFVEELKVKNNIKNNDLLIAIHPGVSEGSIHRAWPKQNFVALINNLADKFNARIFLIGGSTEKGLIEDIYDLAKKKPIKVTGVSINSIAALLKNSTLFIGNNSGPMHVAASVGTPTVALFGDTDPRIHAPYGNKSIVVRKDLSCSPCHYPFLHGTLDLAKPDRGFVKGRFSCIEGDFKCMKLITVTDVSEAVDLLLKDIGKTGMVNEKKQF